MIVQFSFRSPCWFFDFVESENADALAPHVIDVVTINQAKRNRSGVVIGMNSGETNLLKVVRATAAPPPD